MLQEQKTKQKGLPVDPANWIGIGLKEPGAKLLSPITNQRLLKVLIHRHGSETLYGSKTNKGARYRNRLYMYYVQHYKLEDNTIYIFLDAIH